MPAKGAPTRLNPVRLQTIPHLRVRRPNQHQQNPCVTAMSSVLSMLLFFLILLVYLIRKKVLKKRLIFFMLFNRLLGIVGIQC
jgi:pheromone shutdown protein TraB